MRCLNACALAAAAAVLWASVAGAQVARPAVFAPASAANAKKLTAQQREEWRFLKEAAAASRFEGEASRMALAKSSDPRVRSFAVSLIDHHADTGIALQYMLHGRGMAPPMLANAQRKSLNRLAKLSGVKFDRAYTEQVGLKYQQEDVQVYERAALATQDPVLKGWITRTLPTLRDHLATAERIAASEPTVPIKVRSPRSRSAAGAMHLGLTQPVAARAIESNNR
jgi:putative membrane protein